MGVHPNTTRRYSAMKRLLMVAASLALLAAVGVGYAGAQDYGGHGHSKKSRHFNGLRESHSALSAYLTGKAEVNDDGEDGAGDPNAKGTASFLVPDERTICYGFGLTGAEAPTAAHIHKGVAGQNGDIVIDFTKGVPKDPGGAPAGDPGASSGCKVLEDEGELAALRRILSNPRGYYVNFHTPSFPDGAVRGQLSRMLYDND
jgi:CHRD domain